MKAENRKKLDVVVHPVDASVISDMRGLITRPPINPQGEVIPGKKIPNAIENQTAKDRRLNKPIKV